MSHEMRCIELVERLLLEAHLVTCGSCVAYVAQLRMVPALLRRQAPDGPPTEARAALLDMYRRAH